MDERVQNLLNRGILPLFSGINKDAYIEWRAAFKYLESIGSPDIEIHFDSTGGSYHGGRIMASMVEMYKGKTTGIVLDNASSMAFLIWQKCDVRVVCEDSFLGPHQIATTFSKRKTSIVLEKIINGNKKELKKYKDGLKRMRESDKKLSKFLASKSKLSVKKALKLIKKDKQLSVKKAVKFGFVDKVIPDF